MSVDAESKQSSSLPLEGHERGPTQTNIIITIKAEARENNEARFRRGGKQVVCSADVSPKKGHCDSRSSQEQRLAISQERDG